MEVDHRLKWKSEVDAWKLFSATFERHLIFGILFVAFCQWMVVAAVYDVTKYGAVGDGKTNDAPAFEEAWADACKSEQASSLLIPAKKTFLTYPVNFQGPCKAPKITIKVLGNVVASSNKHAWTNCPNWFYFVNISNLVVSGTGEFDGRGNNWWNGHLKGSCKFIPRSLFFDACTNVSISGINSKDSIKNHISINLCNNVSVSNIRAIAPAQSPNTDGVHINASTSITVSDSVIGTGDDCIAIINHCSNIRITNIKCGPGHGISVGSLGKSHEVVAVENILVQHCTITGATNGARIKTWEGGSGYARSIKFLNITLEHVENPIIINQHYVDEHAGIIEEVSSASAVGIINVTFSGIRGTAKGEYGIILDCSATGPGCTGIAIEDVNITSISGGVPKVNCTNAHGKTRNTFPAVNCLR